MLGQSKCCIISWRQHESVEELLNCQNVTCLQVSAGTSYVTCNIWYFHLSCFYVHVVLFTKLNHNPTRHYFGQAGNLSFEIFSFSMDKLVLIDVVNRPALGWDFGWLVRRQKLPIQTCCKLVLLRRPEWMWVSIWLSLSIIRSTVYYSKMWFSFHF